MLELPASSLDRTPLPSLSYRRIKPEIMPANLASVPPLDEEERLDVRPDEEDELRPDEAVDDEPSRATRRLA